MDEQERQRLIREVEQRQRQYAAYQERQANPSGLRLFGAVLVSLWNGFWEIVSMIWGLAIVVGILYLVFTLIRGD